MGLLVPDGILILSKISCTFFGGAGVKNEIINETIKLIKIATVPNPSGEIPNHLRHFL